MEGEEEEVENNSEDAAAEDVVVEGVNAHLTLLCSREFVSLMLLDCWTTPWVIILAWIFIGTRCSLCQFVGAAILMAGLCLVVFSDSVGGASGGKMRLLYLLAQLQRMGLFLVIFSP
ncbi:hypothetical protein MKX01_007280 [Papaver californicum]|nr:hypothetical protein MKX01_007280 [Papaver californicum]